MNVLKNTNCQFAIDKMGSAQCALYSLQNLPVDYLKIDSRLLNDEGFGVVIANAIISVAKKLDIIPIASHIEDQQTLQKAINTGITYAQGYYLARPVDLQL
jgi:EAL domain-containing protein (putative c-di-GMP-specific phosphodiesterase class I)